MSREKQPGLAYQTVGQYRSFKAYVDALSNSIRKINYMPKEDLAKEGISLGAGINGEAVWDYANKAAEKALAGVNFDPKDTRFKARYEEIKNIVKQFGHIPDLLEAMLGTYLRTGTSYIDERTLGWFQTVKVDESKPQLYALAKGLGLDLKYKRLIDDIKEPTDAGNVAAQLVAETRQIVTDAVGRSNEGDLEARVKELSLAA